MKKPQKGAMNIVMLLVMGTMMSGLAFSLYNNTSTGQQRSQTIHAMTHGQTGLWLAAKTINTYIQNTTTDKLKALQISTPISFNLIKGGENQVVTTASFTPEIFSEISEDKLQIEGTIYYYDISAKTSSAMYAIFERTMTNSLQTIPPNAPALNLIGDTDFGQDSRIVGDGEHETSLILIGDFTTGNQSDSFEGIDILKATGQITLGNNNRDWKEIHSNTGVDLGSSGLHGTIGKVTSGGDINIGHSVVVSSAHADLNITHAGQNGKTISLLAGKNITITNLATADIINIKANGDINVGSQSKASHISGKNVSLEGEQSELVSVLAANNIECSSNLKGIGGSNGLALSANSYTNCPIRGEQKRDLNGNIINTPGKVTQQTPSTPPVQVAKVKLLNTAAKPVVNARSYQDESNFVFKAAGSGSNLLTLVRVQNIAKKSGSAITQIETDVDTSANDQGFKYWVTPNGYVCKLTKNTCGNYLKGNNSSRPTRIDQNKWDTSTNSIFRICKSDRDSKCITPISINQWGAVDWDFLGNKSNNYDNAPGVYYFEGNLNLASGNNLSDAFIGNTFIATHNITGNSQFVKTASINFTGRDAVCKKQDSPNIKETTHNGDILSNVTNQHQTDFNHVIPTNYCGENNDQFIKRSVGNISLLAGSSERGIMNESGVFADYKGGNITVDQSIIMGTVLAGNQFKNIRNDTTIWGNLLTLNNKCEAKKLANSSASCGRNNLGKTNVMYKGLPDDYSVNDIPIVKNCKDGQADCQFDEQSGPRTTTSEILWAQYL